MHNIKELKLWNRAINLTVEVYRITNNFPINEIYGLTSQLRKSAVSIPSNIAEGAGRNSNNEFKHFLGIANGSAYELETQLIISKNLNFVDNRTAEVMLKEIEEIKKMNYILRMKL